MATPPEADYDYDAVWRVDMQFVRRVIERASPVAAAVLSALPDSKVVEQLEANLLRVAAEKTAEIDALLEKLELPANRQRMIEDGSWEASLASFSVHVSPSDACRAFREQVAEWEMTMDEGLCLIGRVFTVALGWVDSGSDEQ
jgi:hypothetical protein